MCTACARGVTEDDISPDSKVGAGLDVDKACEEQKEHTQKITCIYCITICKTRIQRGNLKPLNPDRLIVLSRLLNTDKKSPRHPSRSTAPALHCVKAWGEERREAEKLNAKLLGLWEGISP